MCISNWILAICKGKKFDLYLSDITGAFDRVLKSFLLAKLHSVGVPDVYLDFLNACLEPRPELRDAASRDGLLLPSGQRHRQAGQY